MISQNPLFLSAKFVAKDLVGDLLYWPVWWYSAGLFSFIRKRLVALKDFEEDIGLTVWVINWGKPMYGQYDFAGRLISIIVRTAGIIFKALQVMLFFILELILIVGWVVLPVVVVWQLIRSF